MAYDANTDYQALINQGIASGADAAYLAGLEAARNEKIAALNSSGTNTGGYTTTYNYSSPQTTPTATTTAGTTTGSSAYTAVGTYNDAQLTAAEKAQIEALSQQYEYYKSIGDMTSANAMHSQAEAIRAQYGYSGGGDGSQYIGLDSGVTKDSGYQASQLPSATSQADYINGLYAAQQEAALQALKSAYDQNIIDVDALAAKIPQTYQSARNQTAATAEQNKANWNEYAAASGLNVGTGAQGNLSMSNQLLGDMGSINSQEANAVNDLDTQRLKIQTQYQNAIAQAIAEGDLAKAQALYQEAVRVDESLVATAQAQADENYRAWGAGQSVNDNYNSKLQQYAETLAAYGDFSGYKALGYTDEQIANMAAYWQQLNGGGSSSSGNSGLVGGVDGTGTSQQTTTGTTSTTNNSPFADDYVYDANGTPTSVMVRGMGMLPIATVDQLINQGSVVEMRDANGKAYYITR